MVAQQHGNIHAEFIHLQSVQYTGLIVTPLIQIRHLLKYAFKGINELGRLQKTYKLYIIDICAFNGNIIACIESRANWKPITTGLPILVTFLNL